MAKTITKEFKHTEIGEIPADWDLEKLRDIADTASGGTPSRAKKEYFSGNVPWVKSGELKDGVILGTEESVSEEAVRNSSAKKFPKGTLLIALYGATVGKTAVLGLEAATNQAVCAIFPKDNIISSGYLQYFLMQNRPTLIRARYGGAQPNISQQIIQDLLVIVPLKPEQEKIAGVLSKIQKAVENQEKIVSNLRELKAALMEQLFTKTSSDWKLIKISDLGDIVTGTTPRTSVLENYNGPVPFVSPSDMGQIKYVTSAHKTLSNLGLKVSRPLPINSTLFVCIGSTIGKVAITGADNVCTNQQINALVPNDKYLPEFVFYLLQWNSARIHSMGDNGPMPILTKGAFGQIDVLVIERKEKQESIANALSPSDTAIEVALRKKSILEDAFNSTLVQLMTGKVRVE